MSQPPAAIRLRLPATSANLGPGFDAVGLAMGLYLTIDAAASATFTIDASGRNAGLCAILEDNLILETYREVLAQAGKPVLPLGLRIDNRIPLGMGCGSSAAALLGGVLLANHFGELNWPLQACMEEACGREGHPDNVAACALGWMTVSSATEDPRGHTPATIVAATCGQHVPWKLLLALPSASLATEKARALLPAQYSRADAVANVQRTALLVAAFALGRGDLLHVAMQDRIHQPYRMEACPLLGRLLPLGGTPDILGVALSGAGPSVLLVVPNDVSTGAVVARIRQSAGDPELEVIETNMVGGAEQARADS